MGTYASALSEHPVPAHAVGEVVGQILEQLDGAPDFCFLFVTNSQGGAVEDIARSVRQLINPRVLIGMTSNLVGAGGQHVEKETGIALLAGRIGIDVEAVRLEAIPTQDDDWVITGGGSLASNGGTLVLIADGDKFPIETVMNHLREVAPGVAIAGGLTDTGPKLMMLDDELFSDGAIGLHLPAEQQVRLDSRAGCRPFGEPMIVTKAERNVIYELAGEPALDRLNAHIEALPAPERELLAHGLHIGVVVEERKDTYGVGDFVVQRVNGADRKIGALAIDGSVANGTTVQFQLPDPVTAGNELESLFGSVSGLPIFGAQLIFGSSARSHNYFGMAESDIETANEMTEGPVAIVGCSQEFTTTMHEGASQRLSSTVVRFR